MAQPSLSSGNNPSSPYSYPSWTSSSFVFPVKLHKLISAAEESGNQDVVSWLPDGKSFVVKDRTRFVNEVMPSFFGASKFRSFQRNLNLWNFTVEDKFPHKGAISHPYFQRDLPQLCEQMKREKLKNKNKNNSKRSTPPSKKISTNPVTPPTIERETIALSPSVVPPVPSLSGGTGDIPSIWSSVSLNMGQQHQQQNYQQGGGQQQPMQNLLDLMAYQQKLQAIAELNGLLQRPQSQNQNNNNSF